MDKKKQKMLHASAKCPGASSNIAFVLRTAKAALSYVAARTVETLKKSKGNVKKALFKKVSLATVRKANALRNTASAWLQERSVENIAAAKTVVIDFLYLFK